MPASKVSPVSVSESWKHRREEGKHIAYIGRVNREKPSKRVGRDLIFVQSDGKAQHKAFIGVVDVGVSFQTTDEGEILLHVNVRQPLTFSPSELLLAATLGMFGFKLLGGTGLKKPKGVPLG
jgi:hypothetical protein